MSETINPSDVVRACYEKKSELALKLLGTGKYDPGYIVNGQTALTIACNNEMEDVALALVKTGKSNPGHIGTNGNTALMYACRRKLIKVALALIRTGDSNLGHVNSTTLTALMYACKYGQEDIALALVRTGESNPGHLDSGGNTALLYACSNKLEQVAIELIQTGKSKPGYIGTNGNTALMYACRRKLIKVALALVRTGESNPGHLDSGGNTALLYACSNKLEQVAIELIHTGESDPGRVFLDNVTCLMIACDFGLFDVALALIRTGKSKPGHVSQTENTVLTVASSKAKNDERYKQIAFELLNQPDSNISHVNNKYRTALMIACKNGLADLAMKIIETGKSNPHYRYSLNGASVTALTLAQAANLPDVVAKLDEVLNPVLPLRRISPDSKAFDIVVQQDHFIQKYMAEKFSICIIHKNKKYLVSTQLLSKQLNDANQIKYQCINTYDADARAYEADNVVAMGTYAKFFNMSSILPAQIVVSMEKMLDALDIIHNDGIEHRFFELVDINLELYGIMSKGIYEGTSGAVSGDHCQPDGSRKVFEFRPANVEFVGESNEEERLMEARQFIEENAKSHRNTKNRNTKKRRLSESLPSSGTRKRIRMTNDEFALTPRLTKSLSSLSLSKSKSKSIRAKSLNDVDTKTPTKTRKARDTRKKHKEFLKELKKITVMGTYKNTPFQFKVVSSSTVRHVSDRILDKYIQTGSIKEEDRAKYNVRLMSSGKILTLVKNENAIITQIVKPGEVAQFFIIPPPSSVL